MQQVEDGKPAAAQFVPRRRIDVHTANLLQRRRIVGDGRDRAVRHTLGLHEFGPRHVHETPDVVVRFTDGRAPRIDHGDAVHVEVVAVSPRLQGPDRDLPDAVIGLPHHDAIAVARDVSAHQPDFVGSRCEDSKDDAPVGEDLRRRERRRCGALARSNALEGLPGRPALPAVLRRSRRTHQMKRGRAHHHGRDPGSRSAHVVLLAGDSVHAGSWVFIAPCKYSHEGTKRRRRI